MANVKKVNLNGVTSGNYGDYEYGSMSTYTPKYENQINSTLGKIENYGDYKSQYQPQIDDAVARVTDNTPYTSKYQSQIDNYVNKIQSDYDPNSDASYLAYKNQYLRGGQKAMQDTMAKAVALSGGFDNSYANSVAQQTYNDYAAALADRIPELAKAAQDMYSQRLNMFQNLDATDYGRWQDNRQNNYNQLSALQGLDNTAYGRWQDNRANLYDLLGAYQNQENTNYGRFKDEYSMWNTAYGQQQALAEAAAAAAGGGGGGGRRRSGGGGSSTLGFFDLSAAASGQAGSYTANSLKKAINNSAKAGTITSSQADMLNRKVDNRSNSTVQNAVNNSSNAYMKALLKYGY